MLKLFKLSLGVNGTKLANFVSEHDTIEQCKEAAVNIDFFYIEERKKAASRIVFIKDIPKEQPPEPEVIPEQEQQIE